MKKIINLSESELKNIVRNAAMKIIKEGTRRKLRSDERETIVPDMFDSAYDEVTINRPKRVPKWKKEANAQAKKDEKAEQRKKQKEKEIDDKWAQRGYKQENLFGESINRAIKNAINELKQRTIH